MFAIGWQVGEEYQPTSNVAIGTEAGQTHLETFQMYQETQLQLVGQEEITR